MAAFTGNPDLLISSLLRDARKQGDRSIGAAITYLEGIQSTARAAWQAGDEFATNISTEGGTTSWMREVPANVLDQLCESALLKLEAAQAAGLTDPTAVQDSSIRLGDFSHTLSNQG